MRIPHQVAHFNQGIIREACFLVLYGTIEYPSTTTQTETTTIYAPATTKTYAFTKTVDATITDTVTVPSTVTDYTTTDTLLTTSMETTTSTQYTTTATTTTSIASATATIVLGVFPFPDRSYAQVSSDGYGNDFISVTGATGVSTATRFYIDPSTKALVEASNGYLSNRDPQHDPFVFYLNSASSIETNDYQRVRCHINNTTNYLICPKKYYFQVCPSALNALISTTTDQSGCTTTTLRFIPL